MKKFLLIDGTGLVYRGFYSIPPFFRSPEGSPTNAVFGFATILLTLLSSVKPDYCVVAFDKKGPTFRHKEFAEYKATRIKAPQELYDQMPLAKEVVAAFSIPLFEADGFEADDIIATVVEKVVRENLDIKIATGDFDMFQLVSDHVKILYPTKGFKGAEEFGESEIKKKYGISPKQVPDFKGLAGDTSDNIKGVSGIGPRGATKLLSQFPTLEEIYKNINAISGTLQKKLQAGEASAIASKKLTVLRKDVPLDFSLDACHMQNCKAARVEALFRHLGFKSLLPRLEISLPPDTKGQQASLF